MITDILNHAGHIKRKIASKSVNTSDKVCAEVVLDVTGVVKLFPVYSATMELSHTRTTDEVFQHFDVKEDVGLTESQVLKARQKYGLNGKLTNQSKGFVNYVIFCAIELPVEEGEF